ncbi:DNA/RNA non-specific endonuclease [Clostridium perfringens]|uniref:DNA/RNA non-specific endonuclease n=1 Tax=Clostridium perfringens TaxID=1502 RepID=UPI0039EA36BA
MRQVSVDYSNTQNLINNLRSILRNLDNEKREVNSALRELYDLENYYYNKGEIVQELEYRQRKISRDIESIEELIDNISRFLNEVKETDGNLANKFKQDIKAYAKKNNIDLVSDFERFLNKLQTGLDIVGCLPVIGDIADAINGVISLARGDIGTALISFIAVVPFVGDAAKGLKYLDKASDLLKLGDKVVDIGKATVKNAAKKVSKTVKKEVLGIAVKGEKAFKNVLEATLELGKNDYVTWIKNKGEVVLNTINDKLPGNIQLCLNNGCLVGDTLVKTKEGLKEIREIKVGELVLSKNEELGITEYKKVTEIHINSSYESCIIKTQNSIIESTTGHLFMIKDRWWTAAIDIKENDCIELSKGSYEDILEIEYRENKYPVKVYNLTIEDNHNYFVEKDEILTHNTLLKRNCKKNIKEEIVKQNIITDGSHILNGKLKPNITYKTGEHEYIYKTNEKGFIKNAKTDKLQLKKHQGRLNHKSNTPGKQTGDHAGHLFGDRFGGSPELDNLVSQAKKVNLSEYKIVENQWAKALKKGQKVTVDINIEYKSGGRPISFDVYYTIDGMPFFQQITQ